MNQLVLLLLTLCGGIAISIQSGVNGELGKRIGSIEGAMISFLIGLLALCLIMFFTGKGQLTDVFQVPKWQLLGGVLGAFYIFIMVLNVPQIGVGSFIVTSIVGQIVMSIVIDHFGWFGRKPIPVDWQRGLGVLLLFVALFLIFRGSVGSASATPSDKGATQHEQPGQTVSIETTRTEK